MEPLFVPMPMIIEHTSQGIHAYDIYSRLFKERIVFLGTPIVDITANQIIAQLLYLAGENSERDIQFYINSPGGSVSAGLAIYDTMQYVKPPISTIVVGMAASMATIIAAAGAAGKRFSLPNSTIHMHQPHGGAAGQASDIIIAAKEMEKKKRKIYEILVHHTGQAIKRIEEDFDRDFYMTPEEAIIYGLIDEVIR